MERKAPNPNKESSIFETRDYHRREENLRPWKNQDEETKERQHVKLKEIDENRSDHSGHMMRISRKEN